MMLVYSAIETGLCVTSVILSDRGGGGVKLISAVSPPIAAI